MPPLLDLPRELRDNIIDYVLHSLRLQPTYEEALASRSKDTIHAIRFEKPTRYLATGSALQLVSRQLLAETRSALKRTCSGHPSYALDVIISNTSDDIWPTWTCVPRLAAQVERLDVTVRFFESGPAYPNSVKPVDAIRRMQKRSKLLVRDDGDSSAVIAAAFYWMLKHFLDHGPSCEKSPPFRNVVVREICLNFVDSDEHRAGEKRCPNALSMYFVEYLNQLFSMNDDTACFGRVVFERVGGITLCVRGESAARFNLRDWLWQMGQDSDLFTSELFNDAAELSDWIAQAERRREELAFDDAVTTEADAVAEPVASANSAQMPSPKPSDGITYARDDVVAGLTSFYKFLAGLHIPESLIVYPPPGGWPMIGNDGFPKCSKNDTVLDLVRHIPYIKYPYGSSYEIYEGCSAVDYRAHFRDEVRAYDPFGDAEHELNKEGWGSERNRAPPAHVVILGSMREGQHGHFLMVDTKEGKAAMNDRQARRSGRWYPITEFFEIMKEHYRVVKVLPHSGIHVAGYGLEMIQ